MSLLEILRRHLNDWRSRSEPGADDEARALEAVLAEYHGDDRAGGDEVGEVEA